MTWKKTGMTKWVETSPLGSKKYIKIVTKTDRFDMYKYLVTWGTNNPNQYQRWFKTKSNALKFISQLKKR